MGPPIVIIITGVAGAGKTTVGALLARLLGYDFRDADEFHSPENVEKMRRGEKLADRDREPWLRAMAAAIDSWLRDDRNVVLACSALKARYRTMLLRDPARMRIVYLKISPQLASERVAERTDHFMPADLVESQFDALEEPLDYAQGKPDSALVIDASWPPEVIVRRITDAL
jgi:gluconokinase